ncbi:MAG: DmsE family decaheme c-type cytochrome [Betaproteobacteria bacterium]|nr:DmsE family decaheme c-type cytochrome [Betaproteobacteria bacterium]
MNNNHRRFAVPFLLAGLVMAMQVAAQDAPAAGEPVLGTDYTEKGADTCLKCHDEDSKFPVLSIFKTKHAQKDDHRAPFGKLQCESCHGPGAKHAEKVRPGEERPPIMNFGVRSKQTATQQNKACMGCHERGNRMAWKGSEHEAGDVACASCHQIHATRDRVFTAGGQSEACFACHIKQRGDFFKSSAHPVRYGTLRCSDCHSPHGSAAAGKLLAKPTLNQTCYSCHAEKRGPLLWEHAPVSEDCSTCHTPHGSVHPALLKKPAPLLCQQCHSPAGHPSVAYTGAALPSGTPSGFLLANSCMNCHSQVHGSNHPSGARLMR